MIYTFFISGALLFTAANAHVGAFAPGMYCQGVSSSLPCHLFSRASMDVIFTVIYSWNGEQGPADTNDDNSDHVVKPLFKLPMSDWWCMSLLFPFESISFTDSLFVSSTPC